jgi:hypothetical protein
MESRYASHPSNHKQKANLAFFGIFILFLFVAKKVLMAPTQCGVLTVCFTLFITIYTALLYSKYMFR